MSCAGNSLMIMGEGVEDLLGGLAPDERPWCLVPGLDPLTDVFLQRYHAFADAASDELVGEDGEPAFGLVDPTRSGRG